MSTKFHFKSCMVSSGAFFKCCSATMAARNFASFLVICGRHRIGMAVTRVMKKSGAWLAAPLIVIAPSILQAIGAIKD